jgi:hypothetical protein
MKLLGDCSIPQKQNGTLVSVSEHEHASTDTNRNVDTQFAYHIGSIERAVC